MEYSRENALKLFLEHNKSDSLLKHALAVEAVMRKFARHYGEDELRYGIIGLLHDLDYEKFPSEHCQHTGEMMKSAGYCDEDIRTVLSHGWSLVNDIEPLTIMEKTLFTIDELTGLITATVYMRPSRSIMDMELKSLKKKFKDKAFAAGCNREIIQKGADLMGMPLDDVMSMTIEGMREAADELGLAGTPGAQ